MKKLLSALLCVILVCFSLVGCAEDVIGEYLKNYNTNKNTNVKIETLNFYIITADDTSSEAIKTVPQNINTYIKEKYKVELVINYVKAKDYKATVDSALKLKDESKRPDIILVNSSTMFDELYSSDRLVMLNEFYNSREYRSIQTVIDKSLLEASAVKDATSGTSMYYTVPNNHIIGTYSYAVVNKAKIRDELHYSESKIKAMTSADAINALIDEVKAYTGLDNVDQFVRFETGYYNDKVRLENNGENYVNVISSPVATKEEAHESGFAIVKHLDDLGDKNSEEQAAVLKEHYSKCMKIIFALNTDVQFKNLLQYGVVDTNYKFVSNSKDTIRLLHDINDGGDGNLSNLVTYTMDPIHTGNIFISYYCDDIVWVKNGIERAWTSEFSDEITKQNSDAVISK